MERVKKLRKEVGMKQKDLAEILGIKHSNFANIENGKYIPNDVGQVGDEAIKVLVPRLVNKILEARYEVDRLEYLLLQFN